MDKRHKQAAIIGLVAVVGVGGYLYYQRKKSSTTSAVNTTGDNIPSGAGNYLQLTNAQAENSQGNYGDSSNSSYMRALAQENALAGELGALNTKRLSEGYKEGTTTTTSSIVSGGG